MELYKPFTSALLLTFLYFASCLYQNYTRARSSGFKLRIFPLNIGTPLFTVFGGPLLPLAKRLLPRYFARTWDLGVYGVEWRDRCAKRERETPGYLVVTPARTLELFIEDGEIANAILARRRDFEQDGLSCDFMNLCGPSLAGSTGEAWSLQRRLIAPMLNERIMETVWTESQHQTKQMISHFTDVEGGITTGTVTGLRKIAFNILSTIGYGMPTKWTAEVKEAQGNEKMDFMDSLLHVVDGMILLVVFSAKLLKQPFMPLSLRKKGRAYDQFFEHSSEMLQKERDMLRSSDTPRNNFLSSLASIQDDQADAYEKEGKLHKPALTEDQITGNLFTFTLAGYDTTANTMAYAVAMLAAEPQWQDWIIEEIDHIHKQVANPQSYQDVLPNLERCLALMFETLRVFTPVAHIVRECPTDQVLTIRGKTYRIPANTRCTLSLDGVGAHRDVWGDDSYDFVPSRWSVKDTKLANSSSTAQVPKLEAPGAQMSFLPWSSGPRVCPGMKMAQTEFLSVILTIFSEYRIEPALGIGESLEEGRARMAAVVRDSTPKLTLGMDRPTDLRLKWVRR